MRALAVLVVVLAGCLFKPGPPSGITDASGAMSDGGKGTSDGSGGPDPCAGGKVVVDSFDSTGGPACGSGTQTGMTVSLDAGQLLIDPGGSGSGPFLAGCSWKGQPFGGKGAGVQSVVVLTQLPNDETTFAVELGGFTAKMYVLETAQGPFLEFGDDHASAIASAVYSESTASHWRIRAIDAHTLVGEYASDPAGTWIMLGSDTMVPSTAGPATLSLTATQGPSAPGSAYLDNLETCLP